MPEPQLTTYTHNIPPALTQPPFLVLPPVHRVGITCSYPALVLHASCLDIWLEL